MLAHGLLSCVFAVFGVSSSGLWRGEGGGGVDNVPNWIHGTGFEFLGIYRLARFKLESSGFRRGRILMWFPLRPSTQQSLDSLPARK